MSGLGLTTMFSSLVLAQHHVVPLTNTGDAYLGRVEVGAFRSGLVQSFDLLFDTGSSEMWLYSHKLLPMFKAMHLQIHAYDPHISSRFRATDQMWSLSYGSGDVKGFISYDTVSMGGYFTLPVLFKP